MSTLYNSKNRFSLAIALLLTFSLANQAQARRRHKKQNKTNKTSITLLMRLGEPKPKNWTSDLTNSAKAATAERRQLIWRAPPQVSLDETRTLLGCRAWDANCIAQIGETLGVQKVVYLDMRGAAEGTQSLRIFHVDVKNPEKAHRVSIMIPDRKVMGLTLAQAYVRASVLEQTLTSLVVTSQPDRAEVLLNGAVVGRTPLMQLTHFSPGKYKMILRHSGHQDLQRDFEAKEGQVAIVTGQLKKLTAVATSPVIKNKTTGTNITHEIVATPSHAGTSPTPSTTEPDSLDWQKPAAWSGLGVGGVLLASAGVVGVLHLMNFTELQKSLNEDQTQSTFVESEYEAKQALLWPMLGGSLGLGALGLVGTGLGTWFMLSAPEQSENP